MAFYDFVWRNHVLDKLAERGIAPEDVEEVIQHPVSRDTSGSSGRPMRFGYIADGRYVAVVFEWADAMTAVPVSAFEVPEPGV